MNQRVAVRVIINRYNKTLLIRRANGRPSILGWYELPGGRVDYGEQPQDAVRRYAKTEMNVDVKSMQLYDVITYIDHDERDIQYAIIVYLVNVGPDVKITLNGNYDDYEWESLSELQQHKVTESSRIVMGIGPNINDATSVGVDDKKATLDTANHYIIYTDGGSRGNPGPSASGFVIMNYNEEMQYRGGLYLGVTTNNQAEYQAVRLALEKALELGARTIDLRMDSMLVVNQMKGIYKIKNRDLWPINERIRELVKSFAKVTYTHVRREFNQDADAMVNKILDNSEH